MPVIHFLFDIWDAFARYGVPQSATRGKSDRWKRGEWTASQRGGIIAAALAGWLWYESTIFLNAAGASDTSAHTTPFSFVYKHL